MYGTRVKAGPGGRGRFLIELRRGLRDRRILLVPEATIRPLWRDPDAFLALLPHLGMCLRETYPSGMDGCCVFAIEMA